MNKIFSALLCAMMLFAGSARADLVPNGSFENGLNDWTPSGKVAVVPSHTAHDSAGNPVQMLPTDGPDFVLVTTGTPTSSVTSAQFWVNTGDILAIDWFFDAGDYLPYNDSVVVSLNVFGTGTEVLTVLLANVASVGDFGLTGWNTTEVSVPHTGWVNLITWVTNRFDFDFDSYAGIDNINVHVIPEPNSLLLVGIGCIGLGIGLLRRKRDVT